MKQNWKQMQKLGALFVFILFATLPIVDALSISNVNVQDVTDNSALITWDTDKPATGSVTYTGDTTQTMQDAFATERHTLRLQRLQPGTAYQFSVASSTDAETAEDNNGGVLHGFATAQQDSFPPFIDLIIPEFVNQARVDISGETEAGSLVQVFINNALRRQVNTVSGVFEFPRTAVTPGQTNTIVVEVTDAAGLTNAKQFNIFVDTIIPELNVTLPSVLAVEEFHLVGEVDEISTVEVTINDNVVFSELTTIIDTTLQLHEGQNNVSVTATDAAGNVDEVKQTIEVDTTPPQIIEIFPLDGNTFYYEGRAEDTIRGKTEPGARVFMFVDITQAGFSLPGGTSGTFGTFDSRNNVRRLGVQDIDDILDKAQFDTTADADGNFKFDDVDFEHPGFGIDEIVPEEIPPGHIVSNDISDEELLINVYVVVVDKVGLTVQQDYDVRVATCFAGFGVNVNLLPDQQSPSLLSPQRLDSGSEIISFVMSAEYRGPAQTNRLDPRDSGVDDDYYEITGLDLQPLCRDSPFLDSHESYQYACQVLGRRAAIKRPINVEQTNWYVRYNLGASDKFTDFDEKFWEEVLEKELRFPFEVEVSYNEKLPGKQIEQRNVKLCRDVVYFVDVPVDPRKVIPDKLIDNAQELINDTLNIIDDILPTLERITRYAGIGCMGSFGLRAIVQIYRRFTQRWEYFACKGIGGLTKFVPGSGATCPVQTLEQVDHCFYIEQDGKSPYPIVNSIPSQPPGFAQCANVEDKKDGDKYVARKENIRKDFNGQDTNAHQWFSGTIAAWETEMQLYTAYRWLCDRVFCHSAPAVWTQTATRARIAQKTFEQRDCPAPSSRTLTKIQGNCYEELAEKQKSLDPNFKERLRYTTDDLTKNLECYRLGNAVYTIDKSVVNGKPVSNDRITFLDRIDKNYGIAGTTQTVPEPKRIAARKIRDVLHTADTLSCEDACTRDFGAPDEWDHVCRDPDDTDSVWKKERQQWFNRGPTMDCWATASGGSPTIKQPDIKDIKEAYMKNQCYCREKQDKTASNTKARIENSGNGPRLAGSDTGDFTDTDGAENKGAWPFNYREWRIQVESKDRGGIFYPKERYYEGRDQPAAFGQNYLLDSILEDEPSTPKISHGDLIGTFQTVCLTGIRARLVALRSILAGFNACLQQVETTGTADAGVCKEIFSQLVCNLVYKAFTLFENQCVPGVFDEALDLDDEAIRTFVKTGGSAITDTMDNMVAEVHDEYGNAKLDEFLQGGSQGLVRNICLAAFGIETGFDLDSFMDAAYTTSFETSVSVFSSEGATGRREFLSFNPTTRQSVYEYRAAWLILPGCNLQNYEIDLVAVTQQEERQYPNIICSAVNNKEPGTNGCDNWNGARELVQPFANGRQITQGSWVDQNTALTVESKYRYDHIKVTLHADGRQEPAGCFPSENLDGSAGVFYFPIHDATPRDILECRVEPSAGIFTCGFDDNLGSPQAWLENIECYDEDAAAFTRCDKLVYSVEDQDKIRVRINVFNSGKKMCMKAQITPENSNPIPTQPWWDIIGFGNAGVTPLDLTLVEPVTRDLFRGQAGDGVSLVPNDGKTIRCDHRKSVQDDGTEEEKVSGTATVTFLRAGNLFKAQPGSGVRLSKASRDAGYDIVNGFVTLSSNDELTAQKLRDVRYVVNGYGVTGLFGTLQNSGKDARGSCQVRTFAPPTRAAEEQRWQLSAELFYPNDQQQCGDGSVAVVLPAGVAYKARDTIQLKVRNTKASNSRTSAYARGQQLLSQGLSVSDTDKIIRAATEFFTVTRDGVGDILEVEALWWRVVSLVHVMNIRESRSATGTDVDDIKSQILGATSQFASRDATYGPEVKNLLKYKLIKAYMGLIENSHKLQRVSGSAIGGSFVVPTPTAAPVQDNCSGCAEIDQAWEEIGIILGVGGFYNPVTGQYGLVSSRYNTPTTSTQTAAAIACIPPLGTCVPADNCEEFFEVSIDSCSAGLICCQLEGIKSAPDYGLR
jgi:hypothetical protein